MQYIIAIHSTKEVNMTLPLMKTIEVTTVQDLMVLHYGKQTLVANELGINRNTLKAMLDDRRPNVVLVNKDKTYTLLK